MAGASDESTVSWIYKRKYSDKQAGDHAMREHPGLKMMKKEGGFNGSGFFYWVRYANPQGVSSVFTSALTAVAASSGVQFQAARRTKYGYITIDGVAMAAARGDSGAMYDLVTMETDGILEEVGDSLAFDLWRDSTGVRGRGSALNSNTITLANANDWRNFKKGMTVYASSNADMSSPRTGNTTVASVSPSGTVTLTSAAAITSLGATDYLARLGDSNGTCIDGFGKIVPLTEPTSGDSFRGQDRSVDPLALAGNRINDTSTSIEENVGLTGVLIRNEGKRADKGFVNPINFWKVVRRLNAKVEYNDGGGTAGFGFEHVNIHTPAGTVQLVSDPDVPSNRGYVGKLDTAYVKTLDEFVHVIRDDGKPSMRLAATTGDGIEMRVRSISNLIVTEPGAWGVFAI